ncbi:MAG: 3-mercaptopyruvate sulfurtransferase [Rhodospirillaceae bacterium]|nr:MAG: 3-mercaptopyruvate sulfurtransferase [Rhodospirillaceae bacterium]
MIYKNGHALVSGEWLVNHLNDNNVRIIDATFYLPQMGKNARQEWTARHIPGAVFIDIDEVADTSSGLPHMLPTSDVFAKAMSDAGISNDHKVIVYDANGGHMAACRMWWTLKTFGHDNVCVLNGGLVAWTEDGHPTDNAVPAHAPTTFKAAFKASNVKSKAQMTENLESKKFQVIDARSEERYEGYEPEPRPTKNIGNIPGSLNVPFIDMVQPTLEFLFSSHETMVDAFEDGGVDRTKPTIHTCGSGVTACVNAFTMYLLGGDDDIAVYDGSWGEWGDDEDLPFNHGR